MTTPCAGTSGGRGTNGSDQGCGLPLNHQGFIIADEMSRGLTDILTAQSYPWFMVVDLDICGCHRDPFPLIPCLVSPFTRGPSGSHWHAYSAISIRGPDVHDSGAAFVPHLKLYGDRLQGYV